MRLALLSTITLLAVSAARPATARAESATQAKLPVLAPGVYSRTFSPAGGPVIRYTIAIPAGYSSSRPVPLILALHFGGAPAGAGTRLLAGLVRPALQELGAIIIAPDSLGGAWNTPENDRAVNLLLDAVLNTYNIDRAKIVVTGYSMGGAGAWYFAGKYPERFSAAVPVAGRPTPPSSDWRVPVLAIHSRNDEVVPIGPAETRIGELKAAGVRADIIILTGITHYETNSFADGLRKAVPWLKDAWNVGR